MEQTSTTASTFTVTIDPYGARSIIADYASEDEAIARFDREVNKLVDDRGGSVYVTWKNVTLKTFRSRTLPTL